MNHNHLIVWNDQIETRNIVPASWKRWAASTFWLYSVHPSTAECSQRRSRNEASCSAASLVRARRRKASLSGAQWGTISRTSSVYRTITLPVLGTDYQNKIIAFLWPMITRFFECAGKRFLKNKTVIMYWRVAQNKVAFVTQNAVFCVAF